MSGSEKLFSIVHSDAGPQCRVAALSGLRGCQAGVEVEHVVQEQAGESGPTRESTDVPGGRRWWIEADTGMYDALNRGFARATGAIYGRLNHDEQYLPDTLRWVADYFSTHPDVDLLFGDFLVVDKAGCLMASRKWWPRSPNRIAWRTEYADLAAPEDLMTQSSADMKCMEMVKSGGTHFIPGSVNDSIWKTI